MQVNHSKVNTPQGWRDVKWATFARRRRGKPCDSASHEQHDLPAPAMRAAVAEMGTAQDFGHRCQVESMRLRLPPVRPLSVLGDGTEWSSDEHPPTAKTDTTPEMGEVGADPL